jgi:hypothetical protein
VLARGIGAAMTPAAAIMTTLKDFMVWRVYRSKTCRTESSPGRCHRLRKEWEVVPVMSLG